MSFKRKGINAERDLIKKFWELGWAAMRCAGSGSSHYPSPDLVAGKLGKKLAIEAKVTSSTSKYFPIEEINNLVYFSKHFGAEPFVAVKFLRTPWNFFTIEDLKQTNNGFSIKKEDCELKGIKINEF